MSETYAYRVTSLPSRINGVTLIVDGDYIIFINDNLCENTQKETLLHELTHISKNHLYDELKDVLFCENEAIICKHKVVV